MADEIKKTKKRMIAMAGDDEITEGILDQANGYLLAKSQANTYVGLSGQDTKKKRKIPRVGFTQDPVNRDMTNGAWNKRKLLPDEVIKEIRTSDHLVATILRARGNTMSMFGHVKRDRFDVGVEINIKKDFEQHVTPEQHVRIQDRIDRFQTLLMNCGYTEGLADSEKMTLADWFYIQAMNGLSFGRMGTEVIYDYGANDEETGKFHRFRPIDIGTIKRTVMENTSRSEIAAVRKEAEKKLEHQEGVRVEIETDPTSAYPWMQTIEGRKDEFFSELEMLVHNFYPSTDVEHNGYPVTPIDTCLTAITTHLSIEAYSKLFFQNGRAAKGMIVINSDEVDEQVLADMKQEFMASINNVANAFRTPVVGVAKDDAINWVSTDGTAKDGEFEFLYDSVSRNILAAFNMSPDELPGYSHLSKATNSQTMSESSNEFKLTAARDTGLRPLIMKFQEFLNLRLFPIIDPDLAKICVIELSGLDAETQDQENERLQAEMPIHGDMDSVLKRVDKEPIGEHAGGRLPFNTLFGLNADKWMHVGQIMTEFMESPSAGLMAINKYRRDPFFLQYMQMLMQLNPAAAKAWVASNDMNFEIFKENLADLLEEMGD
jgi:hypothetical protein